MLAAFGKAKRFADMERMLLSFIADDAFAIQGKHHRFAGCGVFGQSRACVKGHDDEFHFFVVKQVFVDDFSVAVWDGFGK